MMVHLRFGVRARRRVRSRRPDHTRGLPAQLRRIVRIRRCPCRPFGADGLLAKTLHPDIHGEYLNVRIVSHCA